jgi:radical SAM protein with 4Fe4S-binding SPASM domain
MTRPRTGTPRSGGEGPRLAEAAAPADRLGDEDRRRVRPTVYWYLSFRCNLACRHCAVRSSPWVDTSKDLTTSQALRAIDRIGELDAGLVILTGGEILVRRDALEIIRALAERGIRVALETNGLRISTAFAELAASLQRRNLLTLSISLDGATAEAHERLRGPRTFDRTLGKLDLLKAHGVGFGVQAVINRASYPTIPRLFELARHWGEHLDSLQLMMLNPIGRGDDLVAEIGLRPQDYGAVFELIRRGLRGFDGLVVIKAPPAVIPPRHLGWVLRSPKVRNHVSCQFPLLGILPNGDVTVCALSRDNRDLHFGNLLTSSLREIWQREGLDRLRSRYLAAGHLEGVCADCIFRGVCRGGCRAWAYELGGSFDAPLPICEALERAGAFPRSYRLSHQRTALARGGATMTLGGAA